MACITTPSMQVLWDSEVSDTFRLTRGIRQGDPLSPYLFVLCTERLAHLIKDYVNAGSWKPFKVSRGGPNISHVFFADDLILFAESSMDQIEVVKECLDTFYGASGAKVSVQKPKLFLSKNTPMSRRNQITSSCGFECVTSLGRYLGVPFFTGRITKSFYSFIIDNVRKKLLENPELESYWLHDETVLAFSK